MTLESKEKLFAILFSISSVLIVLYRVLGTKLFKLNSIQWDHSGDGFKNFFTFAYHYKHGQGVHFKGMLYPYGDFLPYADAQTSILLVFKFLKNLGIDLSGYELLIIQSLPIVFLMLGIYFMILLFRRFDVPLFYAMTFSFIVVFLSPQLYRIQSHYSLSYIAIIPGLLYWFLHLQEQKWWSKFLFSTTLVFIGFIHPYHLLMLFLFFTCYWLFNAIACRKLDLGRIWPNVLSILIFFLINKYFDQIKDRPANPWGTGMFKSEISDLLPFYGWFHKVFEETLHLRSEFNEGYCYLGILVFVIPVLLIAGKRISSNQIKIPRELKFTFYGTIPVLLFGMGVHQLVFGDLANQLFPFLKQFRGLGRFSWPFYYVGMTTMLVYLFIRIRNNKYSKIIWSIIVLIYLIDIFKYHSSIKNILDEYHSDNVLLTSAPLLDVLESNGRTADEFQAILTLPSGTEGAEKLYLKQDWHSKMGSLILSYQTGLPNTNIVLSRSSLSQVLKINQMASSPYIEKEILNDLNSKLPFLSVVNKSDSILFHSILNGSKKIGYHKELQLYETPISVFEEHKTIDLRDSLIENYGEYIFYDGFDDHGCGQGLFSPSGLCFNGDYVIMDQMLDTLRSNLEVSIWYKIQGDHSNVPNFIFEVWNAKDKIISSHDYRDNHFKKLEIIDDWVQLKEQISISSKAKRLVWKARGDYQVMDHALVTFSDQNLAMPLDSNKVMWNHFIGDLR